MNLKVTKIKTLKITQMNLILLMRKYQAPLSKKNPRKKARISNSLTKSGLTRIAPRTKTEHGTLRLTGGGRHRARPRMRRIKRNKTARIERATREMRKLTVGII